MGFLFMKFEAKVMILSTLLILISVSLSSIGYTFAQWGDYLGQDGDGNGTSQSKSSSPETNQNSMCISDESTSLVIIYQVRLLVPVNRMN